MKCWDYWRIGPWIYPSNKTLHLNFLRYLQKATPSTQPMFTKTVPVHPQPKQTDGHGKINFTFHYWTYSTKQHRSFSTSSLCYKIEGKVIRLPPSYESNKKNFCGFQLFMFSQSKMLLCTFYAVLQKSAKFNLDEMTTVHQFDFLFSNNVTNNYACNWLIVITKYIAETFVSKQMRHKWFISICWSVYVPN